MVWLETLVECKYRHDGTRWVFTPREYDPIFGEDLNDLFVTLDQFCLDRQLNRELIGRFSNKVPVVRERDRTLARQCQSQND